MTWKYGVMKDLHDLDIKGRLQQFIDGFLSKRKFRVRVGSTLSDVKNQEEGSKEKQQFGNNKWIQIL